MSRKAQLTFTVDINASRRQPFSLVGMVTNHAISHWSCGEQEVTTGRAGNRQVLCVLAFTRYRERDERPLFFSSAIHIAHLAVTVYSRSLITSRPPVMNKQKLLLSKSSWTDKTKCWEKFKSGYLSFWIRSIKFDRWWVLSVAACLWHYFKSYRTKQKVLLESFLFLFSKQGYLVLVK